VSTTPENPPAASEPQQHDLPAESQPAAAPEEHPDAAGIHQPVLRRSLESGNVTIRRAPKFAPFLIVGGGVGAVATFILTMSFPVDPSIGFGVLFGYFSLFGIPAGVALAALVVLIIDRASTKRSKAATVEHETVEPESYSGTLE
jgi:hypothetical protein